MGGRLTPRHAIFIGEVATHGNATRGARVAGVPETSAAVTGARWLKNPKIASAIDERRARAAEKYDVNVERTVRRLAEIAYGDVGELLDEDGAVLPVQLMSEAARTLIAGLDVEISDGPGRVRTVAHKIKIADRLRALEMLAKYLKMFAPEGFSASVQAGDGGLPEDTKITVTLVRPE